MEENSQVSTRSIGIKYGLISALIGIIFFILMDFLGLQGNRAAQWSGLIVTAVIIYFAHREYKSIGDGYMQYGQGVGIGVWVGLVGSVISATFTFIYVKYINPGYLEVIRQQQIMQMEERGMSDAEIERAMEMSENFSGPGAMFIFGIIFGFILTLIIALVISAITKNNRPEVA